MNIPNEEVLENTSTSISIDTRPHTFLGANDEAVKRMKSLSPYPGRMIAGLLRVQKAK